MWLKCQLRYYGSHVPKSLKFSFVVFYDVILHGTYPIENLFS